METIKTKNDTNKQKNTAPAETRFDYLKVLVNTL